MAEPAPSAGNFALGIRRGGIGQRLVNRAEREVVGAAGFEPAAPCAQGRCATRLRYAPTPAIVSAAGVGGQCPRARTSSGLLSRQGLIVAATGATIGPEGLTRQA